MKKIITSFASSKDFENLLPLNPGLIIIKLGAPWCKPCQKIAPFVENFFATSPQNVICADLNIDESFDIYGTFKTKRMVNGIPAILMYKKNNLTFTPDDSFSGTNPVELDAFFKRCGNTLAEIEKKA